MQKLINWDKTRIIQDYFFQGKNMNFTGNRTILCGQKSYQVPERCVNQ
jgi:hypothetical protein